MVDLMQDVAIIVLALIVLVTNRSIRILGRTIESLAKMCAGVRR